MNRKVKISCFTIIAIFAISALCLFDIKSAIELFYILVTILYMLDFAVIEIKDYIYITLKGLNK
jgi:cytochrome c-type biogenesis protein CcmE